MNFGHVPAMLVHVVVIFSKKLFSPGTLTVFDAIFGPRWGHVEELTLETLSPVASEVASLSLRSIKLLLGTGIAKMPPERLYVRPSWRYVGAMLAQQGSMLEPCSPILGLCWGYIDPPEAILGYVVFMTSPSFPKLA